MDHVMRAQLLSLMSNPDTPEPVQAGADELWQLAASMHNNDLDSDTLTLASGQAIAHMENMSATSDDIAVRTLRVLLDRVHVLACSRP